MLDFYIENRTNDEERAKNRVRLKLLTLKINKYVYIYLRKIISFDCKQTCNCKNNMYEASRSACKKNNIIEFSSTKKAHV